jgi:hypothetical protein
LHENYVYALKDSHAIYEAAIEGEITNRIEEVKIKLIDNIDRVENGNLLFLYFVKYHALGDQL